MSASDSNSTKSSGRIESLDQFRGYAVAGMFLVNFLGGMTAIPAILGHHHTYCSYADLIMPHFFFAVGFAFRFTYLKRVEQAGHTSAIIHAFKRNLGLFLVGLVVYGLDETGKTWQDLEKLGVWGFIQTAFQRNAFQALTHIAVACLWVLPVIGTRWLIRLVWALASAWLFVELSKRFYYDWVMKRPGIDGGPLGFLTWTVPLLAGAWACDWMRSKSPKDALKPILGLGTILMIVGYGLSCLNGQLAPPPFVAPEPGQAGFWTMSQRAGSASYLTFSAGASLLVYALFVVACDLKHWKLEVFSLLGRNALAAYVLHLLAMRAIKPHVPKDSPWWYAWSAFLVFFVIVCGIVREMDAGRSKPKGKSQKPTHDLAN